jgi:hypothetical protein
MDQFENPIFEKAEKKVSDKKIGENEERSSDWVATFVRCCQ